MNKETSHSDARRRHSSSLSSALLDISITFRFLHPSTINLTSIGDSVIPFTHKENHEGKETANFTASLEQSFVQFIDEMLILLIRFIMDSLKLFSSTYKRSLRISTSRPTASDFWFGKQFRYVLADRLNLSVSACELLVNGFVVSHLTWTGIL